MSKRKLTSTNLADIARFVEDLNGICATYGFYPGLSYDDIQLLTTGSDETGLKLLWGGNSDDGYEFTLEIE